MAPLLARLGLGRSGFGFGKRKVSSIPPVEISFTASNYNPAANVTSTLSWSVLNSTSVSINQGIGSVAASGLNGPIFATGVTRTYILTAIGLDTLTYTSSVSITWGQRQDD